VHKALYGWPGSLATICSLTFDAGNQNCVVTIFELKAARHFAPNMAAADVALVFAAV
jgi:hypothetical protein